MRTERLSGRALHVPLGMSTLAALLEGNRAQRPDGVGRGKRVVGRSPVTANPQPGRNTPCPCGSGRKFKRCHGGA